MLIQKSSRPFIYLAGPFFNKEQQTLIQDIETVLDVQGHNYYSPWSAQGRKFQPVDSIELAQKIAEENREQMLECDCMLAVLDYLLPPGHYITLIRTKEPEFIPKVAIDLPDTGTVWEMGYFGGLERPVIGFTSREVDHRTRLNLMLTQHLAAVCYGFDDLTAVFTKDGVDLRNPRGWKGAFV